MQNNWLPYKTAKWCRNATSTKPSKTIAQLKFLLQLIHGQVNIHTLKYISFTSTRPTRHKHQHTPCEYSHSTNSFQYSYLPLVAIKWNKHDSTITNISSLSNFVALGKELLAAQLRWLLTKVILRRESDMAVSVLLSFLCWILCRVKIGAHCWMPSTLLVLNILLSLVVWYFVLLFCHELYPESS